MTGGGGAFRGAQANIGAGRAGPAFSSGPTVSSGPRVSSGSFVGRSSGQFAQGGVRVDRDHDRRFGRGFGFAAGLAAGSALGYGYYDPYYYDDYAYDDYYGSRLRGLERGGSGLLCAALPVLRPCVRNLSWLRRPATSLRPVNRVKRNRKSGSQSRSFYAPRSQLLGDHARHYRSVIKT